MDYERHMKYYSDYVNSLEYAEEKGEARGVAIGEARGKALGILETAKSMLKEGLDLACVARITGLPKKQIMALKQ